MQVVAIASRKGGSGKTTLTGHLAVQAQLADDGPVGMMDVDPQGSLAEWWNERKASTPVFVQTTLATLAQDLARLKIVGIKLLFIDTPPAITDAIGSVVGVSDLVVVPTRPSPHDLRSASATVELVEHLGKPLIFVVNGATPRARITAEAVSVLSRFGTLAPAIIHQRVDFAASMIDGRTVMELPGHSRSPREIAKLWFYLKRRLNLDAQRPSLPLTPRFAAPGAAPTAAPGAIPDVGRLGVP